MSVMEMSHRSKAYDEIIFNAEASARRLLGLGDDYAVLFLQGGASLQFAMAPMNLALKGQPIEVIHTGHWTKMAIDQLKKGYEYHVCASGEADGFKRLPAVSSANVASNASYVHLCTNNTIYGTQWKNIPDTGPAPVVVDMSSDIFSRQMDFSRFGMIFAGAQKNIGPSGVALVAIRKDLAERAPESLASMLQYRTHIANGSRYNTPPTFGIYVCGLVLEWLEKQGGLAAIEKQNEMKAKLLYDAIDSSSFYGSPLHKPDRSTMNVVFRIKMEHADSAALEETFVTESKKAGMTDLKGHRVLGGLRASVYNAQPREAVETLVHFMREFERKFG